MNNYRFYGNNTPSIHPINKEFYSVIDQRHLYDLLCECWSEETVAPRFKKDFGPTNLTVGQCSITSLLVQDIFGGEIYGIPLDEGGVHCFNKIDNVIFDLTSEQFKDKTLDYNLLMKQDRDILLGDEDKRKRYEILKKNLLKIISK